MEIRGGPEPYIESYVQEVFESAAEGYYTSESTAKQRTGERLLKRLLFDVQTWLIENSQPL